ncbi:hypothetical protein KP004_13085 [Geomonas oryzisoli]|uniref:Uncharacterized protein n=1 Tax=Geomonas oryzisoli TaxID=2847992 RepID=A0ABX8J614_9BACT|nr:hypothetical protein [Geomonas oryzisoli]QWV92154.1 hypothetical protein KP004_13085 [Geomonas oryzisoli]
MGIAKRAKSLRISKVSYLDVTSTPHFPVEVSYCGISVSFEDIYFDKPDDFLARLKVLEVTRKGEALLDGGLRIKFLFKMTSHGGMKISFTLNDWEPSFPGRLTIEGHFEIEGEFLSQFVLSFEKLIKDGVPFCIAHD